MASTTAPASDADPAALAADPAAYRRRVLDAINAELTTQFTADERLSGVFEGGSAATGRADRFSDVDLCVVADATLNDALFAAIEAALGSVARICHTWRVADSAWGPGFAQRFYLLDPAPPFFFVDCSVLVPATASQFLERERHGEALVYFDRNATLKPTPLERAPLAARVRRRFEQIQACWPVYEILVRKELARGRALDAHAFYATVLRLLVELVGMRYRPERFDFGWRYLHHDAPPDVQAALQCWLYVPAPAQIEANLPAVAAMKSRLVDEICARPTILSDARL